VPIADVKAAQVAGISIGKMFDDIGIRGLNVWKCLTAGCKTFSLANGKGMGTNDWVIRSLDD
jgi:hypothetical protein